MNNQPVAYRWNSNLGYFYDIYDYGNGEPLYTTPQIKELSAKEMRKVINENVENVTVAEMVIFLTVCKAILKKAQEK